MKLLRNTYRKSLLLGSILSISIAPITSAHAQNQDKRALLQSLARSFVEKLSPAYEDDNKEDNALSTIPDDTTLLLKPRVDQVVYFGDIYSIKKNNQIYLSLADVINVLELAIDFDEDTKTGSGWFLQEDWEIEIDLNNNSVISRGESFKVSPNDVYDEDGIVFLSGSSIENWFDFNFDYDVSQQYLNIDSAYPLPAVAKNERRERKISLRREENEAQLPRLEQQRKMLDVNTADVSLGTRYTKTGVSGRTNLRHTASLSAQGQVLEHDAFGFATYDNQEGLRNIRSRFSKQSENPDLFGPLKARFYELGDVNGTNLPLTGNDQQDLGFVINNNPLVNSDFDTTDIDGYSTPGWDVELYRNGAIVGSQIVEDDGRYNFEDVILYAGDNDFEVVFYGPQGERRTENLYIPVTEDLLKTQKDTYEVSVQLEERNTYQQNPDDEDPDYGQPNITARYNKFIGGSLGYLGMKSRSVNGDRKTFVGTGVTSVLGGTVYDANFAIDNEANKAVELGARRKIGEWNVALNGQWNDDDYIVSETEEPVTLNLNASALRTYRDIPIGNNATVTARANYQETSNGTDVTIGELGLGHQINRFRYDNILRYEDVNAPSGFTSQDEEITNSFSARATYNKGYVRAGLSYEIKPDSEVERYFSQLNYQHDYRKSADLILEHAPQTDLTRGRLNLNYRNDSFRTSPFIEVNSNDDVYAGLNINFSLVDQPNTLTPAITSERIIGRGLVHAFVYFDKNGSFTYDEGDEPLPEVVVESLNVRKRTQTDENGYAALKGLATSIPTDIVVDEESLPDSFMISGTEGSSVFPIAGQTYNLSFPIHLAGEVDGVLYQVDENGDKREYANKLVVLLPLNNPKQEILEAQAMFDGFFLFSRVPPGQYLMLPKASGVRNDLGNALPQKINIGFDGDVLAGRDIQLIEDGGFVPYKVTYINMEERSNSYNTEYQLEVRQSAKSTLGKLLDVLSFRNYADPVLKTLPKLESEYEGVEVYSGSQEQLHNACSRLSARKIDCIVNVIVTSKVS